MRAILFLAIAALTVFAAADCAQSTPTQRAGVPRWLWMVLIVLVPLLGPGIWLLVSRNARGGSSDGGGSRGPRGRGTGAPDDDPEFLHRLGGDENGTQPPSQR